MLDIGFFCVGEVSWLHIVSGLEYAEKCKAGYSKGPQTIDRIDELVYNSLAHHHTLH